jgi:anti-sigma factor RsiW
MTCPTLETSAAWTLDELPELESDTFEAHLFGCRRCFEQTERMARLIDGLRSALPPILTLDRHQRLRAARGALAAVHVAPGQEATLRLGPDAPIGIWVLHAALSDVERVDFEALTSDGSLAFAVPDVPFDRERGEVLLACQAHYRVLPMGPDLVGKLSARRGAETRLLGEYLLHHEFDSL